MRHASTFTDQRSVIECKTEKLSNTRAVAKVCSKSFNNFALVKAISPTSERWLIAKCIPNLHCSCLLTATEWSVLAHNLLNIFIGCSVAQIQVFRVWFANVCRHWEHQRWPNYSLTSSSLSSMLVCWSPFGAPQMVCSVHLHLLGSGTTRIFFVVNGGLMLNQRQHCAWTLYLHLSINTERKTVQAASAI